MCKTIFLCKTSHVYLMPHKQYMYETNSLIFFFLSQLEPSNSQLTISRKWLIIEGYCKSELNGLLMFSILLDAYVLEKGN